MITQNSQRIQQPRTGRQQATDVISGCHLLVDDHTEHRESRMVGIVCYLGHLKESYQGTNARERFSLQYLASRQQCTR